jgi:hypothetical protein
LIFNLKSDHQGWSSIKYQQLVTFLRKAIKENSSLKYVSTIYVNVCKTHHISSKSSSVLWQTADNSDTAALPRKRKATHRSPSPLDSQLRTDLVEVPTTSRNGPETVSALHEDHVFGSLDTFEATLARPERSQVSRYFPKTSAITQPAPETAPANHSRPTLALFVSRPRSCHSGRPLRCVFVAKAQARM